MQALVPLIFNFSEKLIVVDLITDYMLPKLQALINKKIAEYQEKHPTKLSDCLSLVDRFNSIDNTFKLVQGKPIVPLSLESRKDNAEIQGRAELGHRNVMSHIYTEKEPLYQ